MEMLEMKKVAEALKYMRTIRHFRKSRYAEQYWAYLRTGAKGMEPDTDISYMAAQAVRNNLIAIAEGR